MFCKGLVVLGGTTGLTITGGANHGFVLDDGTETLVNTRMEDDLLVVDRVSRRLTLRAGSAVVGIWNDAFDLDGVPPEDGTTVPGVARTMRAELPQADQAIAIREVPHD